MDLTAQLLNLGPPGKDPFEHLIRIPENEQPLAAKPVRALRAQHRLEAAQIASLVAKYLVGASVPDLAQGFKINRTTVVNHLNRQGIPRRPNTRKLTYEQVAEAADLYQQSWSLIRLGEHYGVDDETVRRALRRVGMTLRPRRGSA